jgi:predicted AlkP superfamily pyrophosphatase or phosphodiesterase
MIPSCLLRRLFVLLTLLLATACAAIPPTEASPPRAPMFVVSLDGFRAEYLERGLTPNLMAIAADGVRASAVKPSFPPLTFPNHYTLVTGLRPDHHGIVANIMEDPTLGRFDKPSDDPRWWSGGVPLWVTAEKAGIRSAAVYWPGSIAAVNGVRPTHWLTFQKTTANERVDQLLAWLDGPADQRPGAAFLYLDEVDIAGHAFGPSSPQTNAAIAINDTAIGRLIAGLKSRGLYEGANLIVLSDHGMGSVDLSKIVYVDQLVDPGVARAINPSAFTEFRPNPGKEAQAEAALLGPHAQAQCWRKADFPAQFLYGQNPRVAPILCNTDFGTMVRYRGQNLNRGDHGFDPAQADMQAFMVARGPAFRHGVTLPPIDNVDLYPMMAKVLGVTPEPNDGNPGRTAAALR